MTNEDRIRELAFAEAIGPELLQLIQQHLDEGATWSVIAETCISYLVDVLDPDEGARRHRVCEQAYRRVVSAGNDRDALRFAGVDALLLCGQVPSNKKSILAALNLASGRYLVAAMRAAKKEVQAWDADIS
jgi:hypothetical protein